MMNISKAFFCDGIATRSGLKGPASFFLPSALTGWWNQRRCYSSGVEDRYIDPKTIVHTYHFQDSLPRLPIPKLEDTCNRYLDAQKPLLTPEQYEETKRLVEKFQKHEGPGLNAELLQKNKRNKHTSYISGPWYDMYLSYRDSIVLNHNPFMMFKDDPVAENNDQVVRATNIITSAMRFKLSLDETLLEPDVFHLKPQTSDTQWFKNVIRFVPRKLSWYGAFLVKAFPLDMSQYARLFCSTRIPEVKKDRLATFENARHMVVMRKGNFYVFDTITTDGDIVPTATIYQNLKHIVEDPSPPPKFPVAALTTENRDTWANIRRALQAEPGNEEALRLIDSAIFVLCLDDHGVESVADVTRTFLHGDGTNRWFDKSFQLVVCKDGKAAVNFEHAWGDGVAVLRFFNEVYKDTTTRPSCTTASAKNLSADVTVRKLEFTFTPETERGISAAKEKFDNTIKGLDIAEMQVFTYGKDYIKRKKLSPDAIMQLAFQMAIFRHSGKFVPTYESCSTAAFKHGRTETIRPASNATVACAEAFEGSHRAGVEEMTDRIRRAADWHSKLTKEAAMGQGFDRHLFSLRILAESTGKVPEIFQDPAYKQINHNILSTSTLSSPALMLGGFGPVVRDGFGVGYGIQDDWLGCNVTSYPPNTDVRGYLECVRRSLEDIYSVLEGKNFKQ